MSEVTEGRRKIRKIINSSDLASVTQEAVKKELERKKRIEAKLVS